MRWYDIFLIAGLVALFFLTHSILNRARLSVGMGRPRILVEALLSGVGLTLWFWLRQR